MEGGEVEGGKVKVGEEHEEKEGKEQWMVGRKCRL